MVQKCDASSLFTVLMSHLDSVSVDINRVSGVGIDGASVMTGIKGGLVFRLRERVPHLVGCHCVAHREVLVVRDATNVFPDLSMIDAGVDITQVAKEVDRTITIITHRYIEYGETFGGGVSKQLSRFIKDHCGENQTLVVEGIDGDGRPTSHRFELSEKPIKKHKFGGTLADCVKLCTGFAKEIVAKMKFRMWDLQQMGGAKLDDSGNCSIASQLCVLTVALLFGESKCSTHQKRELYVSNTPLRFWSVIAFVAGDVALSNQQHGVFKLLLSEFLAQVICCHLGRGAVG
ncbi:unnamed protein product [Closterium sp. NIES-53]